mgnify:CR=1 FL=1
MKKLSLSQMRTLKKHSEHHSKKHMDMMKKLMREGSSFKASKTPKTTGEMSSKEKSRFKKAKTSSKKISYQHRRKNTRSSLKIA